MFYHSESSNYAQEFEKNIIHTDFYNKEKGISSSKLLNSMVYLVSGYLTFNVLLRIMAQVGLFPGAIFNKDEEEINYDDQIIAEKIFEENSDGNLIAIGKKITAVKTSDCNLKNINVIFFNGNGGTVLGDKLQLGPDGKLIYLAKKGATIYSIDYRGFGNRNLLLGPFSMSERSIFEDGENVLNYVMNENENKKIIIYGYSMGGQVAMHVWHYMQENNLENNLAAVILHSPLNNFNKVAGKLWRPLEYLLNVMFINLKSFKEFDKIKPTYVPSYWYSGYTKDSSEFVDLKTTIANSSKHLSQEEATTAIKNELKKKGINNATVFINNAPHVANYSTSPTTDEEKAELIEFKKFIEKITPIEEAPNNKSNLAA